MATTIKSRELNLPLVERRGANNVIVIKDGEQNAAEQAEQQYNENRSGNEAIYLSRISFPKDGVKGGKKVKDAALLGVGENADGQYVAFTHDEAEDVLKILNGIAHPIPENKKRFNLR